MISKEKSQELIMKLIELRSQFNESGSKEDEKSFREHETLCIDQFKYLVTMRTNKYKKFANYNDLNQDGFEALLKAIKNYNPKKGNFFWWAHKYIDTKISRMANLHTTIRYPLKFAKATAPHREAKLPTLIETNKVPDKEYESVQTANLINTAMATTDLTNEAKRILTMVYGLDGDKPLSINKICLDLGLTRTTCKNIIAEALQILSKNIKL